MIDPKKIDEIKIRLGKTEEIVANVYSDISELTSLVTINDKTDKLDFDDATIIVKDDKIYMDKNLSGKDLKGHLVSQIESQYKKLLDHAYQLLIKLGL